MAEHKESGSQSPVAMSRRALENQMRIDAVLTRSVRLKEASQLLGLGRTRMIKLINEGALKAYRQGSVMWMIPMWAIKEYQQREIDRSAAGGNYQPVLAEQAAAARAAGQLVHGVARGPAIHA